jgi:hypothetical protein
MFAQPVGRLPGSIRVLVEARDLAPDSPGLERLASLAGDVVPIGSRLDQIGWPCLCDARLALRAFDRLRDVPPSLNEIVRAIRDALDGRGGELATAAARATCASFLASADTSVDDVLLLVGRSSPDRSRDAPQTSLTLYRALRLRCSSSARSESAPTTFSVVCGVSPIARLSADTTKGRRRSRSEARRIDGACRDRFADRGRPIVVLARSLCRSRASLPRCWWASPRGGRAPTAPSAGACCVCVPPPRRPAHR